MIKLLNSRNVRGDFVHPTLQQVTNELMSVLQSITYYYY